MAGITKKIARNATSRKRFKGGVRTANRKFDLRTKASKPLGYRSKGSDY